MLKDLADVGTVTDIEGNTYRTIKIGDQIRMAENLKTTRFNDGTMLHKILSDAEMLGPRPTKPWYCYHNWG
jgi:uncharacterized protein (TIGR02145 family)